MPKKEATAKESPQLPDDSDTEATGGQKPSPQPENNAANTEAELAEVMGMLKQFEINSPEKVENVVKASQQTGRMAQLLGEQRDANRQLMAKLEALEKKSAHPQNSDDYEEKPVDLEGTIENVISRVLEKEKRKQTEMTQRQWAAYNEIQADEDYNLVKDAWDNYVRQPEVAYSFHSGSIDPVREYNKFVRKFQRKLLQRTRGLLEQVTTGTKKATIPHMEQGTNVPEMPPEATEYAEKKKELQRKYKGKPSADGVSELLRELIPDGDPLLR